MKDITRRRLLWAIPFTTAAVAGGGFLAILSDLGKGKFDPREINTPVLNNPIPHFSLPDQAPSAGFGSQLLQRQTKPILINFFASWCLPCLSEMPLLRQLSAHIDIWGVAYKDRPANIEAFLKRNGNPYRYIGQDPDGTVGINWGISGVPESFLIVPGGIIKWHYPKPLNEFSIDTLLNIFKKQ